MASTGVYNNRIPNGGFNRSALPQAAGDNSWYDLLNMRPLVGGLVQTPPLALLGSLSLLSGESTNTRIHYMDLVQVSGDSIPQYLVVNESNARFIAPTNISAQTRLTCVVQTAVPNDTTGVGYAVLSGINTSDFSSDGDYITIEITGAAQFTWSKNGGSGTAVNITAPDMGFGSHGLVVSFFAITGFNNGDTWVWTRESLIPYSAAETTCANFGYQPAIFQTDLYLAGISRNVMRVRSGIIESVGFNRIYGKYANVFCNHLVIGQFAQGIYDPVNGVVDSFNPTSTPYTVGWSDLNDPDNFVPEEPTDDNEADSYQLPYSSYPDAVNYGITGMAQLYGTLYIYLPDAIYQMQYVGLPAVMQILPRFQGTGCYYPNTLVLAKRGHYFIGRDNVYYFNGLIPTPVGEPVRTKLFSELPLIGSSFFDQTFGYYNVDEQEVVFTYWTPVVISGSTYYQARQAIYMEKYSRWYFRNLPGGQYGASGDVMCSCRWYPGTGAGVNPVPRPLLYGYKQEIYGDYSPNINGTPIVDLVNNSGGAYTFPYAETNDFFYNSLLYKKDATNLFVDTTWTGSSVTSMIASGSVRNTLSAAVNYTALAANNSGNPEQGVTPLRGPLTGGRFFRYNFQWQNNSSAAPLGAVLNSWSDGYYGQNRQIER